MQKATRKEDDEEDTGRFFEWLIKGPVYFALSLLGQSGSALAWRRKQSEREREKERVARVAEGDESSCKLQLARVVMDREERRRECTARVACVQLAGQESSKKGEKLDHQESRREKK